jgi:hypothetical protein
MQRSLYLIPLLLTVAPSVAAQQQTPPCAAPEYRQFDFWTGSWNVFNPQGQQVGTNTITPVLGSCALHEQWEGAGPSRGFSYNLYDRTTGRWHQTWVDNSGTLLLIEGGLVEGNMVLSGMTKNAQGAPVVNRITWTPIAADSVRQLWETSTDQGNTWAVVFNGMYVKR